MPRARRPLVAGLAGLLFLSARVLAGALPVPWQNADVGSPAIAGGATYAVGVFTVDGDGTNIFGTADSFHYVYQNITGDCEIIAEVTSQENTNAWAKAGVMIRDSQDGLDYAGAKHAMTLITPGGRVRFYYRDATDGGTTSAGALNGVSVPYWLRLVRAGDVFTSYESPDGSTWTQISQATITMVDPVFVGLAVTSRDTSQLCTTTFENVVVNVPPGPFNLLSPSNGATDISVTPVLDWEDSTDVGTYALLVDEDPAFLSPDINENALLTSTYTVGAGVLLPGTDYYWRVTAFNTNGNTPATNNDFSFTTTSAPPDKPDLIIDAITPTDATPNNGDTISVDVTVSNATAVDATETFVVALFYNEAGPPSVGGTPDATQTVSSLAGSAQTTVTFSDVTNTVPGTWDMYVVVDNGTAVVETDETNNVSGPVAITWFVPGVELVITGVTPTDTRPPVGGTIDVDVTVLNQGSVDAGAFAVELFYDADPAPAAGGAGNDSDSVSSLAAGTETTVTFSAATSASAGAWQMYAIVDNGEAVDEADEANNVAGPTEVIWLSGGVDLVITAITPSDAAPPVGDTITVEITVLNQGVTDSAAFSVELFRDAETALSVGDTGDASEAVALLAGGSYATVSFTGISSALIENWLTCAIVDNGGSVAEDDETNNVAAPVTVRWVSPATEEPYLGEGCGAAGAVAAIILFSVAIAVRRRGRA